MKTLLTLFLACLLCISCGNRTSTDSVIAVTDTMPAASAGHWLDSLDVLADRDSCRIRIREQLRLLEADTFHKVYTLEKYHAESCHLQTPAPLDVKSSATARTFRTKISEALRDSGVNFAGCYSLVSVPMTGAGDNYWLVDRRTGKAQEFPYKAVYISFSKASNLVIINPKEKILSGMRAAEDPYFACAYLNTGEPKLHTDLRPFYVLLKNGKWQVLAPSDTPPPVNKFWMDYFGR